MMPKRRKSTRGDAAVEWIENYCVFPSGPDKGEPVRLTPAERAEVLMIYDGPNAPCSDIKIEGALAAFLALLHTVGHEARQSEFRPSIDIDTFTIWNACSPRLLEYLERRGERIICPALGTVFPAVAA